MLNRSHIVLKCGEDHACFRHYQAKNCSKRRTRQGSNQSSNVFRRAIYRSSQTNIGWTYEFRKHLDELAKEEHSYVATRQERERYEKVWAISLNSQGPTRPIRSRADLPAALRKFREVKQEAAEAGHQFNPIVQPDLQVRQRQGQQFQPCKDHNTDHAATELSDQATSSAGQLVAWSVDPSTGWIWWQLSTSWSSSSTSWWSPTGWRFPYKRQREVSTLHRRAHALPLAHAIFSRVWLKIESQTQREANRVPLK